MDHLENKIPINKTTALVAGRGVGYVCAKNIVHAHWETPPATLPLMQGMPDLKDKKCGLLTVVGLYRRGDGKGGSRWLVRCVCGRYTVRRSATITNSKDPNDCCEECRQLLYTKRHQYFLEHGHNREDKLARGEEAKRDGTNDSGPG